MLWIVYANAFRATLQQRQSNTAIQSACISSYMRDEMKWNPAVWQGSAME